MGRGKGGTCMLEPFMHLLGQICDADLARQAGCSREYVRQVRKANDVPRLDMRGRRSRALQAANDAKLVGIAGTASDKAVAAKTGVHYATIFNYRRRHNIPPYGMKDHEVAWSEDDLAKLGVISDRDLAEKMGIALITVFRKRKSLGKPMLADGRRK